MISGNTDNDESRAGGETGLQIVGRYRSSRRAHEAGLAVLAAGHVYWVYPDDEGVYVMAVKAQYADKLRREVEIAELKNRYWPPPSIDLPSQTISKLPTICFASLLAVLFAWQSRYPELEAKGMNSSEAVVGSGEYWRVFTAMTLHADIGHLAGNLLGIGLFAHLTARYMGNGFAWMSIIVLAGLSNATNAYIRFGESFLSLGASTAVFAALGLLSGYPAGVFLRTREPLQTRDWLLPFAGGALLFAWMGGGEFPTDVAGHFWSFLFGGIWAAITAWAALPSKLNRSQQSALLAVGWSAIAVSWALALG